MYINFIKLFEYVEKQKYKASNKLFDQKYLLYVVNILHLNSDISLDKDIHVNMLIGNELC